MNDWAPQEQASQTYAPPRPPSKSPQRWWLRDEGDQGGQRISNDPLAIFRLST